MSPIKFIAQFAIVTIMVLLCIAAYFGIRIMADKFDMMQRFAQVHLPADIKLTSSKFSPIMGDSNDKWTYQYQVTGTNQHVFNEVARSLTSAEFTIDDPNAKQGDFTASQFVDDIRYATLRFAGKLKFIDEIGKNSPNRYKTLYNNPTIIYNQQL